MKLFYTLCVSWIAFSSLAAQGIRPVRDTIGYCWNREQMDLLVRSVESTEPPPNMKRDFVAGIAPHDDYLYAARVSDPLFRSIKPKEVVLFGVTHSTVRKEINDPQRVILLDGYDSWAGCGRTVGISPLRELIKNNLDTQYCRVSNRAHGLEHSIEAMIPWLQYFDPDVHITPIMVTAMPFERMEQIAEKLSSVLAEYVTKRALVPGKDIFFLFSSDANHYGKDFQNAPYGEDSAAHKKGVERDRQIAQQYLSGTIGTEHLRSFTQAMKDLVWCGKFSIPVGLLTTMRTMDRLNGKKLTGTILRYSDSYTEGVLPLKRSTLGTTAPFSLKHWVGYLSAGYSLE
jgi:MEMO1 family protein